MNFHDHPEWISEYLDGQLTGPDAREAERHLSACPECRRELAELRRTRDAIRSFQSQPEPREGLEDRILDRAAQARRPGWSNTQRWALAAMALLTVGVCVKFWNETSSPLKGEDRGGGDVILQNPTPHPTPPERPAVGRGLPPQGGKESIVKPVKTYRRMERHQDLKKEMEKKSPSNYAADEYQSVGKENISKNEVARQTPVSNMAKLKNYEAEPAAPAASAPAPAQEAAEPPASVVGSIETTLSEGGIAAETKQETGTVSWGQTELQAGSRVSAEEEDVEEKAARENKISEDQLPRSSPASVASTSRNFRAESPAPAYTPPGETAVVFAELKSLAAMPAEAPASPAPARKAKLARAPAAKSAMPAARAGLPVAQDSTPRLLFIDYAKTNGALTKTAGKPATGARIVLTVADPEKFYVNLRAEIYKLNAQIEKDSATLWTVKVAPGSDILPRLDDVFERSAVDSGVRVEIRVRMDTGKERGMEK